MSEKLYMYDSAGKAHEAGELLLTRKDGVGLFRLPPGLKPLQSNANVMVIPPYGCPFPGPADMFRLRSQFSAAPQDPPPAVLYPQIQVTDDFEELHGYLGWLPSEATRMVPMMEYASDSCRQLAAARALARLFVSMGDSRALLSMVDPDGFFINPEGTLMCYVSADIPHETLQQHRDYIHYAPPELLVCNQAAHGANATAVTADYVLAVLLYRLLLKDYPFAGENPEDRICDGISVFYDDSTEEYLHCIGQLSAFSPELIRMFRRAFDYCSRSAYDCGRPTAGEWEAVFSTILTGKRGGT